MNLAVGDVVVYAAHGVGHVVGRELRLVLGAEREFVVLDLAAGLRVTLPLEQAYARLRAVATELELRRVQQTLRGEVGPREGSWTKRLKDGKAKLGSGSPVELAELVRDGVPRGGSSRRSTGEGHLYLKARRLLVSEICCARSVEPEEADAWIDAQVAAG